MLDWTESEKRMLAEEAKHMESILDIPGLNADIVAVMSSLYRTGWRDCWIVEMFAHADVNTNGASAHKEKGKSNVH